VDKVRKIRSRKQKTDIRTYTYSFVNRTIQVWKQLTTDALGTLSPKPSNFRKMVSKVRLSEGMVEIIKYAVT
jgi:hypothetical protein